jgi:heme/copper-type cytochrome/quinol oxidase subunit 2
MVWGHIMTEASSLTNFNFGFSTHKSDILIHLSQWQYWWWFWFSILWAVYFFIILRVTTKRVFHLNPIMNTSIRGHGKWGDFLVALIPLSWCGNILVNSNFILRMIEWQNEGSLFTLRVQGKQWYWVYKFDATTSQNLLSAYKNIGHNKWFITTPTESYCADDYYEAIQMGSQLEYIQLYHKLLKDDQISKDTVLSWANKYNTVTVTEDADLSAVTTSTEEVAESVDTLTSTTELMTKFYDNELVDDTSKYMSNVVTRTHSGPLNILPGVINKQAIQALSELTIESNKSILFTIKYSQNGAFEVKPEHAEPLWGFKQKKYKRLQKFKFADKVQYDPKTLLPLAAQSRYSPLTLKSSMIAAPLVEEISSYSTDASFDRTEEALFHYHNSIKFNRHRGELVPLTLARRLLRTKRTLVLPAHVNITVITNSYDVVHSWFIPGLGLKLDCVPGRSTHHSFYIDNVGFYYGQCAEICGRYHHHMPIRLCALPFEQFLVWWQRRGVRRMHRIGIINDKQTVNTEDIRFRYKW